MGVSSENFLASHGKKLIQNGYRIVPIKHGYKYPQGIARWETLKMKSTDIKSYAKAGYTGVGILTGSTCAVDIDMYDEGMATKITLWCRDNLGARGVRIGQAPKVLIPFRTETPFKKACTASWYDVFEGTATDGSIISNRVELLGLGQQYVAFGTHPETGKPYTWKGSSLLTIRRTDLPLLTQEGITELFNYVNSIIPEYWEPAPGKGKGEVRMLRVADDEALMNASPPLDVTLAELDRSLSSIDPNEYDTWLMVGMALYHQYCGSHEGFKLWCGWSQASSKYNADEMWSKWVTFESSLESRPVTAASILQLGAQKSREGILAVGVAGAENKPETKKGEDSHTPESLLDMFISRYVYIAEGDRVADLKKPSQHSVLKLNEFRNLTAPIREPVSTGVRGGSKMVSVCSEWLVNVNRETAQGSSYLPGGPRITVDSWGLKWVNEFNFPTFNDTVETDRLGVFVEHFKYLLPVPVEREWFLDWVAFNVQRPAERCKVTPLLVSKEQGTGRGWLVEFMQTLLGPWNVTKTKMSELVGDGKFLNSMARSLLCAVEEVKEGGGGSQKFSVSDKIRDLLTEKHLEINIKYGSKGTVQIFCNFFFMTNHADALVIPPEDRRINVFSGPEGFKPMEYYDELYGFLKDHEAVSQAYRWLMRRDLSKFNWKRSMKTAAREAMIGINYSDTECYFRTWLGDTDTKVFSQEQLLPLICKDLELDPMASNLNEDALRQLIKDNCRPLGPTRLPGGVGIKRLWKVGVIGALTTAQIKTEYALTTTKLRSQHDRST